MLWTFKDCVSQFRGLIESDHNLRTYDNDEDNQFVIVDNYKARVFKVTIEEVK